MAESISIQNWFYQTLKKDLKLKVKHNMLDFVHNFGDPKNDTLEKCLLDMADIARFPLDTEKKFKPGTSEYADCVTTYLKTLKALEVSGSRNIFGFLIRTMCWEDNHIAADLVTNSLMKVIYNFHGIFIIHTQHSFWPENLKKVQAKKLVKLEINLFHKKKIFFEDVKF